MSDLCARDGERKLWGDWEWDKESENGIEERDFFMMERIFWGGR